MTLFYVLILLNQQMPDSDAEDSDTETRNSLNSDNENERDDELSDSEMKKGINLFY